YFDSIKKGATILGITTDNLKEVNIPNVDKSVQDEFASFVDQIDKSKFIIQKQIKLLEELLEKKMNEYFGD
ncbi:MAG: restriction endonuclease subunit S, partial [Coprobacillus sp.]|nr:restriction endonuclease subunit S [Coprobacillus sp.]